MNKISIAIDGPASAGKSTVAKILAAKLGYIYVDTGAMYRAMTWAAEQNGLAMNDGKGIAKLLDKHCIRFTKESDGQHTFWDDEDITTAIRQPNITNNVSEVSAQPEVRERLVEQQRDYGKEGGIVMDGRDIGTTVLPKAEVKIFLVASVEERAERRYKENLEKGITTDFETLKQEIADRDHYDSTREVSPLVQADDAVRVDTTGLNIDEVVAKINDIINEKVKKVKD